MRSDSKNELNNVWNDIKVGKIRNYLCAYEAENFIFLVDLWEIDNFPWIKSEIWKQQNEKAMEMIRDGIQCDRN